MKNQLELETLIPQRLLESGLVEELKGQKIYIWSINHFPGRVTFSVDITQNPRTKMKDIQKKIQEAIGSDLGIKMDAYSIPMDELCCYRQCKGCLNGDPETQSIWIH